MKKINYELIIEIDALMIRLEEEYETPDIAAELLCRWIELAIDIFEDPKSALLTSFDMVYPKLKEIADSSRLKKE